MVCMNSQPILPNPSNRMSLHEHEQLADTDAMSKNGNRNFIYNAFVYVLYMYVKGVRKSSICENVRNFINVFFERETFPKRPPRPPTRKRHIVLE